MRGKNSTVKDPGKAQVGSEIVGKTANVTREVNNELLDRAVLGDAKALDELIRANEATVYKFAYRVCRSEERAKETAQETFVNVIRKLHQFDRKASFSTWLYSIVTNNCLMQRRSESKSDAFDSLEIPVVAKHVRLLRSEQTSEHRVLHAELRSKLDEAIQALPLDHRIVFVLRDLEEVSTEETAAVLKLSVPAVKSRLRRARLFLRDRLAAYVEGRS